MGERGRAAVAMVVAVALAGVGWLVLVAIGSPALAQVVTLPPPVTTEVPATTTTEAPATTTTRSTPPTAVRTTTTRRSSPTTSERLTATTRGTRADPATPGTSTTVSLRSSTTARGTGVGGVGAGLVTTTTDIEALAVVEAPDGAGLATGTLVALTVAGLLAVAVVLSLITVRYVRQTQPGQYIE